MSTHAGVPALFFRRQLAGIPVAAPLADWLSQHCRTTTSCTCTQCSLTRRSPPGCVSIGARAAIVDRDGHADPSMSGAAFLKQILLVRRRRLCSQERHPALHGDRTAAGESELDMPRRVPLSRSARRRVLRRWARTRPILAVCWRSHGSMRRSSSKSPSCRHRLASDGRLGHGGWSLRATATA